MILTSFKATNYFMKYYFPFAISTVVCLLKAVVSTPHTPINIDHILRRHGIIPDVIDVAPKFVINVSMKEIISLRLWNLLTTLSYPLPEKTEPSMVPFTLSHLDFGIHFWEIKDFRFGLNYSLLRSFLHCCRAQKTRKHRFWPILSIKALLCDAHILKTVGRIARKKGMQPIL